MSTKVDAASELEPVIIMTRIFAAPRALVWKVSTEPEHIVRWWGGEGFTNPVCEIDLRPGGLWRHVMRAPDGTALEFDFEFLEVQPPERLSWRSRTPIPGGRSSLLQTIVLEDLGDGRTGWTLIARADSFADREAAIRIGYTGPILSSLEALSAYLTIFLPQEGPVA